MAPILYAMLVIYVIVCIILWGLLLYAAGQGGAGDGFAIIFMVFVPFWPAGLPFALYGLANMGASLVRNAVSKVQPVATAPSVQPVIDVAKTKEAADAAIREKAVAPALAITVTPVQPQPVVAPVAASSAAAK